MSYVYIIIDHISTISGNILNTNQNSLSTLDIQYIPYFYSVFPLHLNSFNTLFGDVINPLLSNLKPAINQLIRSHSLLSEPLISLHNYSQTLKINFDSLSNILPTESIIHPFIVSLKQHLKTFISKFDLTTGVDIINLNLFSIMKEFHENFKYTSKQISTKLDDHIKQIESNIESISNETKNSIRIITSKIDEIKIEDYISKLEQYNNSLGKFNKYTSKEKLVKISQSTRENMSSSGIKQEDMNNFDPVYLRLNRYKRQMRSYQSIQTSLNEFNTKLTAIKNISNQICTIINGSSNINTTPDHKKIDKLLLMAVFLKDNFIIKLKNYIPYFYTLEQIGMHMRYLKSFSKALKDKLDPEFCSVVKSLEDIYITQRQIHTLLLTIKTQIDYIIPELQLIKSLLQYRDSVKIMLLPLNSCYIKNNVYEFLKDSKKIIETLSETSKTIKNIGSEIDVLKSKNRYLSNHVQDDLQNLKSCISQIPHIIKQVTLYFKIIRYIICELQIIKSNSTIIVKQIKAKINLMSDLSSGLKQLREIYSETLKFYYIHVKTTFFLNYYSLLLLSSKFQKSLKRLNEIIYETGVFIYFITVYYAILYHINVIVKNMENLKSKVIALNKFNNNFNSIKSLVSGIIEKLKVLKSNISKLESIMYGISASNLRDEIMKFKYQIEVIREDIDWLMKTFNHSISYIENTVKRLEEKCKEIIKEIQKYINYLSGIILIKEILSIPSYLTKEDYQNPIIIILSEIKKYSNMVKSYVELINKDLKLIIQSIIANILILELLVNKIVLNMDIIEYGVNDLEYAIEGVARNFIKCSTKQISNNLRIINRANKNRLIKDIKVAEVENHVMSMYSLMSVMNYWVVVNRLYDLSKKIDKIFEFVYSSYGCFCIGSFENKNHEITNIYSGINKFVFRNESSDEIYKMKISDEIKRMFGWDKSGNHVCLCKVIKYVLYPQTLNLVYLISCELQMLSTMSRNFDKYIKEKSGNSDIVQWLILIISIVYSISNWVRNKYPILWIGWTTGSELKCYCTYNEDKNYQVIVSIILVLASLIENIWAMDIENIRIAIESLSKLMSEFDIISVDNSNRSTDNNNKKFYDIISSLFCPLKFCTLSSKLQLISAFVTFCYYDPVLTNQIKPYASNLSLCNIDFENVLEHFKDMNINSTKSFFQSLLDKYKLIDGSNNLCNQFKNQCCVLSSNIIIIVSMLISVKIKSKLYPKKCEQLKLNVCDFLKCVCKCKDSECCLKNILESKDQICNGNNNNCDQLINKCVELCCDNKYCNDECPCKEIKSCCDKLNELCCKTGQNGLCKLIETIQKCGCNTKQSCNKNCRCVCCKIVMESILILENMFRSNVRIISKDVIVSCRYILEIIDKIKKTNNSDVILKSIVNNNSRYNRVGISLVKHNYINSNSHVSTKNISLTNVETRNWGYDTKYEHDVSTDKGFRRGDGYPHVTNSNGTDINNMISLMGL